MKQMMQWMLAAILISGASMFTSCAEKDNPVVPEKQSTGIDVKNFDTTVRPADDFYQYANGGWMANNPLPAAYSRYGTFEKLMEENTMRLKDILDEMQSRSFASGSTEQKLNDLYRLAMDSDRRNKEGVQPLMGIIQQLEEATTSEELFKIQLQLALQGYSGFMTTYIDADDKNATQNILTAKQGGITLEQKEYYLDADDATTQIREGYKQNIVKMLQLFGFTEEQATAKMTNIMRLETELAKVSRSETDLRDPEANYNKMTLAQFESQYPHVQLEKIMNAMGVKSEYMQELIVGQPEFFAGADNLIASMTAEEYRDYMEWRLITSVAGYLDDKLRQGAVGSSGGLPPVAAHHAADGGSDGRGTRKTVCREIFPPRRQGAYAPTRP